MGFRTVRKNRDSSSGPFNISSLSYYIITRTPPFNIITESPLVEGAVRVIIYYDYDDEDVAYIVAPAPYIG